MPAPPTPPPGRLGRLADVAFRRRRTVVLAWLAVLVAAIGLGPVVAGEWSADYSTPGSESQQAAQRLADGFPERSADTVDVVWRDADGAASPEARERIAPLLAQAQRLEGIGRGVTLDDAQRSPDGTTGIVRLQLTEQPGALPETTGERLLELREAARAPGLEVALAGQVIESAEQGGLSSEAIGVLIAALVLLLTFGSAVAAGLPLVTALFGVGVSATLIGALAAVMDVPDWGEQVAAMIGIGVGIDYALLVVTRFRHALDAGASPHAAVVEAVGTAGRSVVVAGTTVVISMLGLFLMGLPYLRGVAVSTSLGVLVVMAASLTLLPAMLGALGPKVHRLRVPGTRRAPRDPSTTLAARWSRAVQRRPRAAVALGVAVLVALAAPVAGMRIGFPDAGSQPEGTSARTAYDMTAQAFGAGAAGPLLAVAAVDGPEDRAALARVADRLERAPGVASVAPPAYAADGRTAVLAVQSDGSPQDEETKALIDRLRDGVLAQAPLPVELGGATAQVVDQSSATSSRLPLFIGGVIGLSVLLLLAAFRSVAVPLKAAAMNLLSIGAAYGIVSLVADGGALGQLVGIDTETPVPPFIPVMMFAILFGLSMDYEVFLMSRVREEHLAGRSAGEAVTEGVARTARVITAAAAIMVAVFGAFVLSDQVVLKLIGVGLATAVLIDATVVRMVVVPAVMGLLGERGWWMPRWLDRLVPRTELEPPAPVPSPA